MSVKCAGLFLVAVFLIVSNLFAEAVVFTQAPVVAASQDKAQGTLMLGTRKIELTFVAGAFDTAFGKTRALVYLANGPFDPFSNVLQGQIERGELHLVQIIIQEDGSIIGFNLGSAQNNSGALMGLNAAPVKYEPKVHGGNRVQGRVFNTEPVLFSKGEESIELLIDVTFSAALLKIGARRLSQAEEKPAAVTQRQGNKITVPPDQGSSQQKTGPQALWSNAPQVIDEIIRYAGPDIQPIFIIFNNSGGTSVAFHYQTAEKEKGILSLDWQGGEISGPRASGFARPCPPFQLKEIDLDLVSKIFADMDQKTGRGYHIVVQLGRQQTAEGCKKEVEWQGVAQYLKKLTMVTYAIDGSQTDIKEYSF